jgi:hypothetical protein
MTIGAGRTQTACPPAYRAGMDDKAQGVLTDAEFEQQKATILNG